MDAMITQEYLKECVTYDPGTGVFTWLKRPESHFVGIHEYRTWNTKHAGDVAGTDQKYRRASYRQMCVNKTLHPAHRLAWLYMHGEFPQQLIDHIDGNGLNNRIVNLREVTNQENLRNQRMRSNNTSGYMGVSFDKREGKWYASIGVDGRKKILGYFTNLDDAVAARKDAEIKYGFHENHGRPGSKTKG